jgi:DNA replication and repair protein RecF
MRLRHLSLSNFRNFIRLESAFPPGPTILVGSNGQGKTSLLEAIHYLTAARSLHTISDRELINFLALEEALPVARLVAEIESGSRPQRIEIRLILDPNSKATTPRVRKEILINGVKKRVRDLAGVLNAVIFLPLDMNIIEGSPGVRRRYIDDSLSQADPVYAAAISDYQKVLTQRNALLKQMQENKPSYEQLVFWDEQISNLAGVIIRKRSIALAELEQHASPVHKDLTRDGEVLRIEYLPAFDPLTPSGRQMDLPLDSRTERSSISADSISAGMMERLEQSRQEEISRGMTLTGPHRDEIRIRTNGIDLGLYGSRGQNRSAILAMKLGEIRWLQERTGEWPILLLDEVLAELDINRRSDLLSVVESAPQTILTAADLDMFTDSFRDQATVWEISGGKIAPLGKEA